MSALCQQQALHLERQLEYLSGSPGALAAVEPVHLGWLHQAIRVWSGRYGTLYGQCAQTAALVAWVAIIVDAR